MRKRVYTVADVREMLEDEVGKAGSQRSLARRIGVSVQFLSQVLAGESLPGDKIPAWLGLREVGPAYEKRASRPRKGKS